MCRLTRRRKARASRPSTRSRERPEARFGCKGRVRGSPRTRLALTSSGRAANSRCPQSAAWLYLGAQVAVYDHVEAICSIPTKNITTRLARTYRCTRTRRSHVASRLSVARWRCQFWVTASPIFQGVSFRQGHLDQFKNLIDLAAFVLLVRLQLFAAFTQVHYRGLQTLAVSCGIRY
jgi:hypothetical protein